MVDPQQQGGDGRAPWPRSRSAIALGVLLLIAVVVALRVWPGRTAPTPDDGDDFDPEQWVANPGYVGIETCAECHARRAEQFKTSRHYLACTTSSGVTAPGFAPGRGRCDTRFPGLHFEMTRKGDDCFAAAIRPTPQGQERTSYQIAMVYGSGNPRDEMYFAWEGERLVRLPLAWLHPQGCWGTDVDDLRVRNTPTSCLECHNTWITHAPGPPTRYRREGMLLGVTCERCHGPGREHTEHHRKHPRAEAHAIVHPRTLSRERLIDVCAQCHGNTRLIGMPFSYRPGEPLESAYRTGRARFREDDTTTNQVQYLGESRCFQKSQMTCITCHDPHVPKSAHGGCMKCHTAASCPDQPRQPAAVRADCVGCHMPQHVWMNSHFYKTPDDHYVPVAPRSEHRIGVYPWARQAVLLAWLSKQDGAESRAEAVRLRAALTEHWLAEAERRREAGRPKAAIGAYREALQITPNPATRQRMQEVIARQTELDDLYIQLDTADRGKPEDIIAVLKKILELHPEDARATSELGTVYAMTGRRELAIPLLRAVARLDPSNSSGLTRLAWMADREGRPEEAASLCAEANRVEPGQPMNHFVWGMASLRRGQWEEAEQHFRKTLRALPADVGANRGLSEALRQQGEVAEAIRFGRRAVRASDSKSPESLLTLAEAYADARRSAEARRALEQALTVADPSNRTLIQTIRTRLQELR